MSADMSKATAPTDLGSFEDHLAALRNANAGAAITVWKDGTWKSWQTLDAKYAERDENWLATIPFLEAIGDAFDIVRKTALEAATSERAELLAALRALLNRYVDLAGSGDCGSWNPEEEKEVIDARAALAKAEERK